MSTAVVAITDHGAKPDTLCTQAIQAAIDFVARTGGTVYVPPGKYITGTLVLRSGVTLHVDPAAVLLGSPDIADYPPQGTNTHEGQGHFMIYADGAENVTITGGGVIDGNGPAFWQPSTGKTQWRKANRVRVTPMLEFRNCRRLRIENIRIANSPGWTVHPFCCDDVTLRGVRVENDLWGPNTDGFDVNGCRDVFITDCHLVCGDDAIILKATPQARSTERVVITNCVCKSNCIGIGIGQETQSDIRQVAVSNCVVYQSHRMFTIGIWDGGVVEDIVVTGMTGDTLGHYCLARPIQMEIKQLDSLPKVRPLGTIRNVSISNFVCRTEGRILITAEEGSWIDGLTLRDIRLRYTALEDAETLSPLPGERCSNQYANHNLEARKQNAAVILENVRQMQLDGLWIEWPERGTKPHGHTGEPTPCDRTARVDPPHRAIWARHVNGSILAAPLATGSHPGTEVASIGGCSGTRSVLSNIAGVAAGILHGDTQAEHR